jgi:23S rRNA pseudouridine2605 synthase
MALCINRLAINPGGWRSPGKINHSALPAGRVTFLMKEACPTRSLRPFRPRVSLARALSKLGHGSRTQALGWIGEGKVRVNGLVETDGARRVDPAEDRVEVEGRAIPSAEKVYLVLNKPRGLVTTASDEKGRATVYDCLGKEDLPWLTPVGRLDKASEGLLLFTNDTRWAGHIMDPRAYLDKTYHVQIGGLVNADFLKQMTAGIPAKEGGFLQAKRAGLLRQGKRNCWLEVVLDEGKNRHIRRLLAALGTNVLRLVRVAIGPLPLGNLPKGRYRRLNGAEISSLAKAGEGIQE